MDNILVQMPFSVVCPIETRHYSYAVYSPFSEKVFLILAALLASALPFAYILFGNYPTRQHTAGLYQLLHKRRAPIAKA